MHKLNINIHRQLGVFSSALASVTSLTGHSTGINVLRTLPPVNWGVRPTYMKRIFATVALVLLGACSSSPEPRYGIDASSGLSNQKQAEIQLIERSLSLQTTDKKLDIPIKLIHAPLPGYPDFLRAENIYGTVRIKFVVEEDGTVSNPQIIGAPPAPLAAISINALLAWRFLPIFIEGKPTKINFNQTFTFKLEP